MSREIETGECVRLADAIADGRFLEAPDFWRPHVRRCPVCKQRVEGLFLLRSKIRAAADAAPIPSERASGGAVKRAFARFHARRRQRRVAMCVLAALFVSAGAFVWWRHQPATPVEVDSVDYARRLHGIVFPGGGRTDYERLQADATLRAEFVRALDHRSSLVRRTALVGLTSSGVEVDPARLARSLSEWREDLERPLQVAATGSDERALEAALSVRRAATVRSVAQAIHTQASRGGPFVPSATLVPFLSESREEVRLATLRSLTLDPGYQPGDEVWQLLRADPSPTVRATAAICLMRRLGTAGARAVVEHVRQARDYALENQLLPSLGGVPGVPEISRTRVAAPETPIDTALSHVRLLVRSGERAVPESLVAKALRSGSGDALYALASVAWEANWTTHRGPLQEAWKAVPTVAERLWAGEALVHWDVASDDPGRLELALDIIAADHHPAVRPLLGRLQEHKDPKIRTRAREIERDWPGS